LSPPQHKAAVRPAPLRSSSPPAQRAGAGSSSLQPWQAKGVLQHPDPRPGAGV